MHLLMAYHAYFYSTNYKRPSHTALSEGALEAPQENGNPTFSKTASFHEPKEASCLKKERGLRKVQWKCLTEEMLWQKRLRLKGGPSDQEEACSTKHHT